MDKNRSEFDKAASTLQKEFASNQPKEYYEIVFHLNSGHFSKAKEFYLQYVDHTVENKLHYIGGLIYANLYRFSPNMNDYEEAKKLYLYHLENKNPNFFEKLEIYKFFSVDAFNKLLLNQFDEEYRTYIEQSKVLLHSFKNSFYLFDSKVKKFLQDHYLHCLYVSNKQDFVNYYQTLNEEEIDVINFIFYHLDLPSNVDNLVVERRILGKSENELLIHYLSKMVSSEAQVVIDFIDAHQHYKDDEIVSNIYLEAKILTEKSIDDHDFDSIVSKKDDSIIRYISYLEAKKIRLLNISTDEVDSLIERLNMEPLQEILVIKAIRILAQNGLQKKYLQIALQYKDKYQNIISETLKVCEHDRNLLISDFDSFIEQIKGDRYSIQIANIYRSYPKIKKAYDYFKKAWEHFDFLDKDRTEFASYVLETCSIAYYYQSSENINRSQDGIYKSYLEEHQESLNLHQTFVLAYYLIVVEATYDSGFFLINKKLLEIDIKTLGMQEKEMLASLYFYTIAHKLDVKAETKTNLLLKENGVFFIANNIYSTIDASYSLTEIEPKQFDLMRYRSDIERFSVYHHICNYFIDELNSKVFFSLPSTEEDPLSGIREFIHDAAKKDKELLEAYSNGENISFHNLAHGSYRHYFGLIDILLNSESIAFYAGKNHPQPFEVNKILTLSSIIFLNYIGKLDIVLAREDIYVQQTTINWLLQLIDELNNSDEILTVFSDGSELYKNLSDKQSIEADKQYLLDLANKITSNKKIVDDTDSVFQIRESYEMIAPHIGEQEYRAIAFALENKYQIISEDRMILFLYEKLHFNTWMVSNSISVLSNVIEPEEFAKTVKELDKKNYSYIINEQIIKQTLENIIFNKPLYLMQWDEKDYSDSIIKVILQIVKKYGWLDWLEQYYDEHYVLKVPKVRTKPRSFVTSNIEYIFDLLGIKIEGSV